MRALRAGRGGATQFLATVEPAGTVSSCRLLVGSGDAQLDETTCSVMQRRARFEPFEGARRPYVGTVVWMIGD
nr:TonB family protein [Sphingomonas jejuensis]